MKVPQQTWNTQSLATVLAHLQVASNHPSCRPYSYSVQRERLGFRASNRRSCRPSGSSMRRECTSGLPDAGLLRVAVLLLAVVDRRGSTVTPEQTAHRGRGGLGTCGIWNGEIWCGENLSPTLKYHCKILVQNSQTVAQEQALTVNGGCYFLWTFGWSRLFPGGFSAVVAGHKGNVHAKSAKDDRRMASDLKIPRHNMAYFCHAKFCHSKIRLFLIFPSPGTKFLQNWARDANHTTGETDTYNI